MTLILNSVVCLNRGTLKFCEKRSNNLSLGKFLVLKTPIKMFLKVRKAYIRWLFSPLTSHKLHKHLNSARIFSFEQKFKSLVLYKVLSSIQGSKSTIFRRNFPIPRDFFDQIREFSFTFLDFYVKRKKAPLLVFPY